MVQNRLLSEYLKRSPRLSAWQTLGSTSLCAARRTPTIASPHTGTYSRPAICITYSERSRLQLSERNDGCQVQAQSRSANQFWLTGVHPRVWEGQSAARNTCPRTTLNGSPVGSLGESHTYMLTQFAETRRCSGYRDT